jgi:hypothetical protein
MLLDDDVVGGHPYLRSVTRSIMGCRPDRVCGWAMAGIARNIELYNSAYDLAWKHISELQKREQPEIARRLHDSIRRQLSDGVTEPLFIALEALGVSMTVSQERSRPRLQSSVSNRLLTPEVGGAYWGCRFPRWPLLHGSP